MEHRAQTRERGPVEEGMESLAEERCADRVRHWTEVVNGELSGVKSDRENKEESEEMRMGRTASEEQEGSS